MPRAPAAAARAAGRAAPRGDRSAGAEAPEVTAAGGDVFFVLFS